MQTHIIVWTLFGYFDKIISCLCLDWQFVKKILNGVSKKSKRTLETLYLENKMCNESLNLISQLLKRLKRLSDKMVLVKVQLFETYVYHASIKLVPGRSLYISQLDLFVFSCCRMLWTYRLVFFIQRIRITGRRVLWNIRRLLN